MKNIFKSIVLLVLLFAFTINAEAQKKHKKAKKEMVKQLHLTKQQKMEMKAFKATAKKEREAIKSNSALTEEQKKEQLELLQKKKPARLEAILTSEQKEKLKQTKNNQPRRGVTNRPNERTAK
jgi:outer membrane protein assembly factor BamD (BamD/ComL family)